MSEFMDAADPQFVFGELNSSENASASSFPELCEDYESLSIPNRGMVLAVSLSGALWIAIIFGVRLLWLLLR